MSAVFCDLAARARGLATRLYTRAELIELARASDLDALAAQLKRPGRAIGVFEHSTPSELDRAVRRGAAEMYSTLERWTGDRRSALDVLFDEQDTKSLRAMIRGSFAGASSEARLRGLTPTTTLPERALEELASETQLAGIAARLAVWRHPFAGAIAAEAHKAQPSLLDLEAAIDRLAFQRALAGAERGDAHLLAHVRRSIDVANVWTALSPSESDAIFFEGGATLNRELHRRVHRTRDRLDALIAVAAAFADHPSLRGVFEPANAGRLEVEVLRAIERGERRATLLDPSGSAPIVWWSARLNASTTDLSRIIWGLALLTPRERMIEEMITS